MSDINDSGKSAKGYLATELIAGPNVSLEEKVVRGKKVITISAIEITALNYDGGNSASVSTINIDGGDSLF